MSELPVHQTSFCSGGKEIDRIVAYQPLAHPDLDFTKCIDMVVAVKGQYTESGEPGRWDKFMAHLSFGKEPSVYPLGSAVNKSALEGLERTVNVAQRLWGVKNLQIWVSIADRNSFGHSKQEVSMSIRRCQRAVHLLEAAQRVCDRLGGELTVFTHPAGVSKIMLRSGDESLYYDDLNTELYGSDKIPLKEYRDLISELVLFDVCMSLAGSP